jgi:chromosome segregation ATPase
LLSRSARQHKKRSRHHHVAASRHNDGGAQEHSEIRRGAALLSKPGEREQAHLGKALQQMSPKVADMFVQLKKSPLARASKASDEMIAELNGVYARAQGVQDEMSFRCAEKKENWDSDIQGARADLTEAEDQLTLVQDRMQALQSEIDRAQADIDGTRIQFDDHRQEY